jgi:hypothetical protein
MRTVQHVASRPLAPATPRTWARVRALLHPGALDRRLAAGADPARDPELAARATILLRRTTRMQIAEGLQSAAASARSGAGAHSLSAVVPVAGVDVLEASDDIEALAQRLSSPEPVRPQGVALARELLVDGAGPLYVPHRDDTLALTARHALIALDRGPAWV